MDNSAQRFGHGRWWRWIILAVLLVFAGPAHARTPQNDADADDDAWSISANQLQFDKASNSYLGIGRVSISRRGQTLTADRILFDQNTRVATAEGQVRLVSNGDWLAGEHLRINLETEVGQLTGGTLFSAGNHLYLSADTIHKIGPASYRAQKAVLTACDDDPPSWKISAGDLEITMEGYGVVRHAAFWARNVPVLYTPIMAFPVKLQRQTGLLTPQIGHSTRKGGEYLQPFYWAINQSSDATFYSHLMSERGLRTGLEYRYVSTPGSMGIFLAEGFSDTKVDDGTDQNSLKWGYAGDDVLRPNEDRYWVRAKVDQELPYDFKAKLDLDIASDQDYLHEFKSGLYGFDQSRDEFINTFGRDIDDYTDPIRGNRLNLSRTWMRYALNMDLRWNDDVIKRRQAETDNTLQRLPVITFNGLRQPVGGWPIYFNLTSSYTNFFRLDGERGHRADVYPRIYYPIFVLNGVSLEPSIGLRQTAWRVDRSTPNNASQDGADYYRTLYDFQFNAKTEFFKTFDWHRGGYDRLKHAITPELSYSFLPDDDQGDLPFFDSLDRIERQNLITLSLTNTLTLREPRTTGTGQPVYDYGSFLRFKLSQGFDIYKHNEDDPRPFGDLKAEFDLTPGRLVRIDADGAWSLYDSRFNAFNVAARIWNRRGDRLDTGYRYTRENIAEGTEPVDNLRLAGTVAVSRNWQLRAAHELNRKDQEALRTQAGVTYQSQCWSIDFDFALEGDDRSYTVMINLLGLGGFGN